MNTFSSAFALGLLGCFAAVGTLRADDTLRHIQQSLHDQGFYYGSIDGTPGDETTHAIQRYQIRNGLAVTGQLNAETIASINRNESTVAKGSGGSTGRGAGTITGNSSSADDDRRYAQGSNDDAPTRSAPAPAYRPPPPPARPDADDQDEAPAPRAPVNRPDLRAPPSAATDDDRVPPRNGIAPSEALTRVFERTPYEFAPPPVQADILRRAQAILLRDGFYDGEANGRPNPVTFEALANFQGVNHLRRTARLDAETLAQMGLMQNRRGGPFDPRRGPPPVYEGRLAQ